MTAQTMKPIAIALAVLAVSTLGLSACGGKRYLPPPEERPGELEPINPNVRMTDERAPYSVDVPVQ